MCFFSKISFIQQVLLGYFSERMSNIIHTPYPETYSLEKNQPKRYEITKLTKITNPRNSQTKNIKRSEAEMKIIHTWFLRLPLRPLRDCEVNLFPVDSLRAIGFLEALPHRAGHHVAITYVGHPRRSPEWHRRRHRRKSPTSPLLPLLLRLGFQSPLFPRFNRVGSKARGFRILV